MPDNEERVDLAIALLEDHLSANEKLIAPPLLLGEITNTIHRRLLKHNLSSEWPIRALDYFLTLPITVGSRESLYHDALRIASRFRLPAIYDAQYVALAHYAGCDRWTDDRKLIRAVQQELPFVRALSDYDLGR